MILKQAMISSFVLIALWGQIIWMAGEVRGEAVKEITVSAAISLKNAFTEIGELLQKSHPGVKVNFNFGASGDLMAQIRGGAPVEIFASAALKDMDQLEGEGFIVPGTRQNIAANEVVLIQPFQTACPIQSFDELRRADIKKIALGNPKSVPAGRYAAEVFQHYQLGEPLQDKLILAENVRQVLDYVARGEVEAGVVYRTDAMAKAKEVRIVAVAPENSHKPVVYPLGMVKGSKNENASREFIAAVVSAEGKEVLKKYGFGVGP